MNKIIFTFVILILFFSSCKDDEKRTSFMGSWNCEEHSDELGTRLYQTNILRNPYNQNDNDYVINNFHNLGSDTEVFVTEEEPGKLTITGTSYDGIAFTGSGVIAEDFSTIKWQYQVNDGLSNPWVTSTYY